MGPVHRILRVEWRLGEEIGIVEIQIEADSEALSWRAAVSFMRCLFGETVVGATVLEEPDQEGDLPGLGRTVAKYRPKEGWMNAERAV